MVPMPRAMGTSTFLKEDHLTARRHEQRAAPRLTERLPVRRCPVVHAVIDEPDLQVCHQAAAQRPPQVIQTVPLDARRLVWLGWQRHLVPAAGHLRLHYDSNQTGGYGVPAGRHSNDAGLITGRAAAGIVQVQLGVGDRNVLVENTAVLLQKGTPGS